MTRVVFVVDVELHATYTYDDERSRREIMVAVNTGELVVGKGDMRIGEDERQCACILWPLNIVLVRFGDPPVALTRRQYEVMFAIGDGMRAAEIAKKLGISRRTVYMHTRDLKQKFGAQSRAQMISIALELGLIDNLEWWNLPDPDET
ncbi:MAG: helix-turn-helix transcriptional regulator [Chloroflexi bacterium]|nr:helix-turn-helix transcriptional regulator [Chloroflexota bacterium]